MNGMGWFGLLETSLECISPVDDVLLDILQSSFQRLKHAHFFFIAHDFFRKQIELRASTFYSDLATILIVSHDLHVISAFRLAAKRSCFPLCVPVILRRVCVSVGGCMGGCVCDKRP